APSSITGLGIARTFQNIRLFANMTALENVLVGQHSRMKANLVGIVVRTAGVKREEEQARAKGMELLKFVELDDVADEAAKNLPYGDQRRLEIARALASDPKLLLLDEPTAGMNPNETGDLIDFIRELRVRLCLTTVTIQHEITLVEELSVMVTVL